MSGANWVTLAIALVAVVGTMSSPLVANWSRSRIESRQWQRQHRLDAYLEFLDSMRVVEARVRNYISSDAPTDELGEAAGEAIDRTDRAEIRVRLVAPGTEPSEVAHEALNTLVHPYLTLMEQFEAETMEGGQPSREFWSAVGHANTTWRQLHRRFLEAAAAELSN